MAETKFTPGPWKRNYSAIISAKSDSEGDPLVIAMPYGTHKGNRLRGVDEFFEPPQAEADANATLIAAAPAMFAKLHRIATWLEANAKRNEDAAKICRFESLNEAYRADAKNYRATAKDIRVTLAAAEGKSASE